MKNSAIPGLLGLVIFLFSSPSFTSGQTSHLEETICGSFKEPLVFWLWSSVAGSPDKDRIKNVGSIKDVSFTTIDGKVLRGYKFSSPEKSKPKGYLLVAQGNAMIADQIIDDFSSVADHGYDVFIFDFRGYGRSEGKRRLKAILNDYKELTSHLDAQEYKNRAFYGMSFGGVLLLDALKDDTGNKIVIIDSVPSTLSDHGCPNNHDPIANVKTLFGSSLFIFGQKDNVVPSEQSYVLSESAKSVAQDVIISEKFGHPFMDGYIRERMELIREFLARNEID